MNEITATVTVAASAEKVWRVVAHEFHHVGRWATAVPASQPVPGPPPVEQAPVAGRVCHLGLPMLAQVSERIVAYDETARTLTYQADLLPRLLTAASNTWQVNALAPSQTRVSLHATVHTGGVAGRIALWLLRPYLARTGSRFLADLRHYVEHGHPSPSKQRRTHRTVARANASRSPSPAPPGPRPTASERTPPRRERSSENPSAE